MTLIQVLHIKSVMTKEIYVVEREFPDLVLREANWWQCLVYRYRALRQHFDDTRVAKDEATAVLKRIQEKA